MKRCNRPPLSRKKIERRKRFYIETAIGFQAEARLIKAEGSIHSGPVNAVNSQPLPRAAPGLNETQIWEQFAAACRGEGPPAVTAQSVLPTMALLDAARESSRMGQAIPIAQTETWEL